MPSKPQDFKKSKKNLQTTSAAQWKKGSGAKAVDVELPSGNVAKLRQIPMPTLLADGLFPDSLSGFIRDAINVDKPKEQLQAESQAEMAKMMEDPSKMADMFTAIDKVSVLAIVEPKVVAAPESEDDRDEEILYIDEVDLEDKMFVFNFCVGGSKELGRFREESAAAVGSLAAIESVQNPSE